MPRDLRHSIQGYLVHVYTASTLFFVALAAQWLLEGAFRWALGAIFVTMLIDATDGALARKYRVKETAAAIDGVYGAAYAGLAGVRLQRVDDSFHFVMVDQPDRFAAAVDSFLRP